MNFIKGIIFIALSLVIAFFTNWLFEWLVPLYMNLGWIWLLLIFFLIGGFLVKVVGYFPMLFSRAIVGIRSFSFLESFIVTIILVIFTFVSGSIPWDESMNSYSFKDIFAGITADIMIVQIYLTIFKTLVQYQNKQ